jgi:ABC-type nickel/cobalt efflux system permease component RcnA
MTRSQAPSLRKHTSTAAFVTSLLFVAGLFAAVAAHPLGNFTVNHFTRLQVGGERIRLRYVVDMAEIPTVQELQTADADGDGSTSATDLNAYLARVAAAYPQNLRLEVDGERIPLQLMSNKIFTPAGVGGLPTLRIELDLGGALPPAREAGAPRTLSFEDTNHPERLGWHEIVVKPEAGILVFDSSAFGSEVTDELKAYPENMLSAPLDERKARLSFTRGKAPDGAAALTGRDGRPAAPAERDRFAELIAVPELTPGIALLALFAAAGLGGLHALSPGHGKAVVGAYLVGSRGTARHAAFLGLTVTITHTLGVFALGLVTLFASQYVLPERLFPILSLTSGAIVLVIGLSLFVRRLRAALGTAAPDHEHEHGHEHTHQHPHEHGHSHPHEHTHETTHHHDGAGPSLTHTHGGRTHSHLPPGADGVRVTWRSLLALGVSGGLLPCPSALVVLLSAISLHRVGFGMLLIVAFSLGLASVLTGIGLAFIYAGRMMKGRAFTSGRAMRLLPAVSAFVIACVGAAICYEALVEAGLNFGTLFADSPNPISTTSVLLFGLVLGLKHAVEADHLAAVSAIVSERKSLLSASLVGGLWGVGHTISLLLAGVAVILLRVEIGRRTEMALEFGVALMLVVLGADAIRKLFRGGRIHLHAHEHGGRWHVHPHIHDGSAEAEGGTHHGLRLSKRPLVVGMVHGLAGSAALMLLVLSTIPSPLAGLIYIAVFGVGSIGGMMLMSALVGLPVHFTANRFARANLAVRCAAGVFSLCFGLLMAYEIGFVDGLFR